MELNVALVPVVRILMNSTMLINQLLLDPSCFHYSLLVHGCPSIVRGARMLQCILSESLRAMSAGSPWHTF